MRSRVGGEGVALLRLARPHNGVIAALGVLAGAWWAVGRPALRPVTLAVAVAALLLAAFANAVNDWCDVEIDRVAHPERPLPSGAVAPRAALGLAAGAALGALAILALAAPSLLAVTVAVLAAMTLYSTHLKSAGLPGNLLVALLASLPFLYGGWAVGAPRAALPLVAVAVPLHVAREIAKDLDDASGDRAARRTLPVAFGAPAARVAFAVALLAFVAVCARFVAGRVALALLLVPVGALCALAAVRVARARPGAPTLLKAAMVCAIVPLLLTRT